MNGTLIQPSWDLGYATGPDESEFPDLWEGLEGYWSPGLGPTGLTLFDIVGGNPGDLTNMVAATDWVVDPETGLWALDYDGISAYLAVPDPPSGVLDFGTADFTLMAWIKTSNATNDGAFFRRIISKRLNVDGYELTLDAGVPALVLSNSVFAFAAAPSLADGEGKLVVVSIDRNNDAILYVNGTEVDRVDVSSVAATDLDSAQSLFFGQFTSGDGWYDGRMNDVGIWSRLLLQQEIAGMFAGDSPLTPKLEILGKAPAVAVATGMYYRTLLQGDQL